MTTNNISQLDNRSSIGLRRALSDVHKSSQYRTTASIQLQKSAEEDSLSSNKAALKAFHTARLKSTLDFFRKKEELNKSNQGTSLSRGRPVRHHASFTYGHHRNNLNNSSSYQNGRTLPNFASIEQRSSEPKSYKNDRTLNSSDDKTPTRTQTRSSSELCKMKASSSSTRAYKAERNCNCVKTDVSLEANEKRPVDSANGEANGRRHTDGVNSLAENTNRHITGQLPTLEQMKQDIERYDKELHECNDYEKRRAFRAKIRELRKLIKEEKYNKAEEEVVHSSDSHETSTANDWSQTGTVHQSKTIAQIMTCPVITEESSSVSDSGDAVSSVTETDRHSEAAKEQGKQKTSETNESMTYNDHEMMPKVIHGLQDQMITDGQPCIFKCSVSAPDGASVIWYHDGKLLESSNEIKQSFVNGKATIDISEVFPDDEGEYKCVITCATGQAETTARLTVLGKSDVEEPKIRVSLEDQTCFEGDTITLKCVVCGKPRPTISWSRDGYPLFDAKRYSYSYSDDEAVLVINDAITGDEGSYMCEAHNSAGSASSECVVDVKASPQKKPEFLTVLPSTHSVSIGKNLTLTCHVTGRPRPDIKWYHETQELTESPHHVMNLSGDCAKLTLQNVTTDMAGSYTCVASNYSGGVKCITTVNVRGKAVEPGKPVFITPLADVVVPNGTQSFTLRCCIEARPRPIVLWQKGTNFIRTGSRYNEKFDGCEASLEIRQLNKSDTDSYTCVCRNEFGKVKSTCTLTVQDSTEAFPAATKMSEKPDINSIDDEDELYKLMNATDDFEERKKIRARMREIREAKAAEFERRKKEREEAQEDAVKLRLRLAEEQKRKKMEEFEKQAREGKKDVGIVEQALRAKLAAAEAEKQKKIETITEIGKAMTQVYHAGSDILRKAEEEKQKKLQELSEEGISRTTKTEKSSDGGTTVTSTTVTTHKTKDGSTTTVKQTKQVTQVSGLGGTSYAISKPSAASKPTGPRGARAAFQQMDKATAPPGGSKPNFLGGGGGGGRVTVQRSPSTIKQMLLDWCKSVTKEYEPKVSITNFSSSWNNGLAFCALIHHFYPDAFNFDELDPKKRRHNFTLAFETAEKLADIAPLLDVEDMVRMKNPDWKCVFTYVQSFYRRFRNSPSTPTTPVTPVSPEPQTN